eukprot:scaffold14608_cov168-Amphora_coffeaeformis.AAC.2
MPGSSVWCLVIRRLIPVRRSPIKNNNNVDLLLETISSAALVPVSTLAGTEILTHKKYSKK